jgi:hypothetical protein
MWLRTALVTLLSTTAAANVAAQAVASPLTFSPSDYASDSGARAVVAADFDLDGATDFATANAGANTIDVFMNREFSGGGFTLRRYAVGAGPFDLTVSDFNFDSYPDLVVAAADADEIDVLFGAAGGQFQAPIRIPVSGNPRGVAVGYFGLSSTFGYSIVYSSFSSGTISFLDYDYETATFTRGLTLNAGTNPQGIAIGQFKASGGYPDIVVANSGGSQMTVFYNSGSTFSRAELKAPTGARGTHLNVIVAADFDKDGRTDLAAASTGDNYVAVWMNSSSGLKWTANLTGAISSPRGIAAEDLNADGRPEIIVANRSSNSVAVFVASASSPFFTTPQSISSGSGSRAVAAADFDGDGRIDLATGNEYAKAATVQWNRTGSSGGTGATAFVLRALPDVTADPWTVGGPYAVADFNHNGIPDIVVGDGVVLDAKTAVKVDSGRASASISSALVADFNEDGDVDIAQDTYYNPSPQDPSQSARALDLMLGDGTGHFTRGTSLPFNFPRGMATGDFNRDGHADLVVFDDTGAGVTRNIFLGRGDGTFAASSQPAATYDYLTGTGDINGDGKLDLVVWNYYTEQITIYFGDGRGGFPTQTVVGTDDGLYGAHIADLNGDGRADIVALKNGTALVTWLGQRDGTLSAPLFNDLPESAYDLVVADLTGDSHPDVLTSEGTLAIGRGDGTFSMNRNLNITFTDALAADIDRDGLIDLFIGTFDYTAMALYNRRVEPSNTAPVAKAWPHTMTLPFAAQFDEESFTLMANKSFDPDIDPISITWFEKDRVLGNSAVLDVALAPGTHVITLVVRDTAGAESRDTATITITPYTEIVAHTAEISATHGGWTSTNDSTAADGTTLWHPNANAAKLAEPLANPVNYVEFSIPADPTQAYKLWLRLKAQGNSPSNDSVFVQFDGAVDASGKPIYQIGTTSGLAINLEECSGCGLSGWGWRDEAWGTSGAIGTVTLQFPPENGSMWHRVRIQTREDGVMVDQVVLSSATYASKRPGAVKNDRTILTQTIPEG